ncbi:MAG: hypothetical protein H7644_05485, partial [Candidatus Heimdallarchaeota archaeon]|nr:hypothetical protein [Candidatus Heimdallarchaeota archaeon]MCK5143198.1 hypothetical protein [Candidatus Heimdallarchaeota archaeon]
PELNTFGAFEEELGEDMIEKIKTKIIFDDILPNTLPEFTLPGSTDVGDVSWIVPTSQIGTSCVILGTPGHSWQEVTQCTTSISHKGMIAAAKVMALTALEFMENIELVDEAKAELNKRLSSTKYESPIASEVKPNVPEWVIEAMK